MCNVFHFHALDFLCIFLMHAAEITLLTEQLIMVKMAQYTNHKEVYVKYEN